MILLSRRASHQTDFVDLASFLHRAVDYDLWANRQWLACLDNLPDPARGRDIVFHMADAHICWLTRVGAEAPIAEEPDLDETLAHYAALWQAALAQHPVDHVFHWTDNGDAYQLSLADIVFHIVNHGTYHRGHLRGLADAGGVDAFNDTDYDWFASP